MTLTTVSGTTAQWTGVTDVTSFTYTGIVFTRYTATVSGAAGNWNGTPVTDGIPASGPDAVSKITGNFSVVQKFEASKDGINWDSFLDFYDLLGATDDKARRNVFGEFWYDPPHDPAAGEVPLPAALPLFGAGVGLMGLLGWRRKKQLA